MLEIKLLNREDILYYQNEISDLLNECMLATYSGPIADNFITEKLQNLEINITSGRAYAFLAVEEKNILGFLWSYPLKNLVSQRFHVAYISVAPKERRKGIGKLLLKAAENQAKKLGIDGVELIVSNRNIPAIDFYEKCGYGTGKFVLEKNLNGER